MSSTSNQEVFRAYVEGRLIIDMLRVVLVSFNLSTFTLGECSQVNLRLPACEVLDISLTGLFVSSSLYFASDAAVIKSEAFPCSSTSIIVVLVHLH